MGWLGLLLKFGSLAVIDKQMILLYSIFYNEIYLLTKHEKVKVSIILSQTKTRQKRDDI